VGPLSAVGATADGVTAAGAYYRGGCGYDAYGNWVCPNAYYPYRATLRRWLWCSKPMVNPSA